MNAVFQSNKLLILIAVLAVSVTVFFAGCGKFKEDFQRGVEHGRKQAEASAPAPLPAPLTITANTLTENKRVELDKLPWKYQPGDDAAWANPKLDDTAWETVIPVNINRFLPPKSGWKGIGWFRLRINIDESLVDQPLSLAIKHPGASEIYINGELAHSFGRVAAAANDEKTYDPDFTPVGIAFKQGGEQTIAIRYSNTEAEKYVVEELLAFQARFSLLNPTISGVLSDTALKNSLRGGIFGICLALGLLHLLLYVLYPRQRGNLFYSLFLLAEAFSDLITELFISNAGTGAGSVKILIGTVIGAVYFLSFTAYLYTVLENRIPRYLRVMLAFWAIVNVLLFITYVGVDYQILAVLSFFAGLLLFLCLMMWHIVIVPIVIVRAVVRGVDNSWILGLVGFSFIASCFTSMILALWTGEASSTQLIGEFACLTSLIIANAIFLARQFARTSTDLEVQLVKEVEHEKEKARLALVEAENERRTKELEEARQLQFSMLPKNLPQLPNLEIAAYMKPATEVGGDYYDFHIADDGTLTVAVGDATGHGLKAGTMVTATKSLFNNLAGEREIESIFRQSSLALKKMNLRGLYMAMTMAKMKDNRLVVSCAGMPPVLIYRDQIKRVEEISIKAMPLGSPLAGRFEEREIMLAAGDCVLMMSDGFPEMFNDKNEMLGFAKAKMLLSVIAKESSQEIINRFVEVGEKWAGTRPADDDVTFVVLKVNNARPETNN